MLKEKLFVPFGVVLVDLALAAEKIERTQPLTAYRIRMLRKVLFGRRDLWQEYKELMDQEIVKTLKEIIAEVE